MRNPEHRQDAIDHGILIRWTKGFGAGKVEGHDVAAMFRQSLKKHVSYLLYARSYLVTNLVRYDQNVPVEFVALINDTTGTLIASAYVDPATKAGIIFGTGCNAAYMEKLSSIPKLAHLNLPGETEVRSVLLLSFLHSSLLESHICPVHDLEICY